MELFLLAIALRLISSQITIPGYTHCTPGGNLVGAWWEPSGRLVGTSVHACAVCRIERAKSDEAPMWHASWKCLHSWAA